MLLITCCNYYHAWSKFLIVTFYVRSGSLDFAPKHVFYVNIWIWKDVSVTKMIQLVTAALEAWA